MIKHRTLFIGCETTFETHYLPNSAVTPDDWQNRIAWLGDVCQIDDREYYIHDQAKKNSMSYLRGIKFDSVVMMDKVTQKVVLQLFNDIYQNLQPNVNKVNSSSTNSGTTTKTLKDSDEGIQTNVTKTKSPVCGHEWIEYLGLSESYKYCKKCNVKQGEK